MQFVQVNRKKNQRQRWQRFWPKTLLVLIAFLQMLLTGAILALEFCSMISNIKYSFFFIGFIASVFYIITWISTFIVGNCYRRSPGCATYVLVEHVLCIVASIILLFYDSLFLRNPWTCLWPNDLCNGNLSKPNLFGVPLDTSEDIHGIKFTLIKTQIACAAVMIAVCAAYIVTYIYTMIKLHTKNTVADSHTIIELGRMPPPPPPYWPDPPKDLPPASEF